MFKMTNPPKFAKGQTVTVDVNFRTAEVVPAKGEIRKVEIIKNPAAGCNPIIYGVFVEDEIVYFDEEQILCLG
jgi:hypothetical protein